LVYYFFVSFRIYFAFHPAKVNVFRAFTLTETLMDDALTESKQRFAQKFVSGRKLDIEPLVADQWVIISLLQKSIRRGEVDTAQRAAFTLFAQKGYAIWRRFMVIAFEDVGAASPRRCCHDRRGEYGPGLA
jgi:replication-associated recombination protein RarA